MPRRQERSRVDRWRTAAVVLTGLCLAAPASAITFTLIGDGATQVLTWHSESTSGPSGPCVIQQSGQTWSLDGRILNASGGRLDWTGQGTLQALTFANGGFWFFNTACSDGWTAIDARSTALEFRVDADPGDPFPLETALRISPTIAGTLDMRAGVAGNSGTMTLTYQMMMTVVVDGVLVAGDTLIETRSITNQNMIWSPAFPKGPANQVTVSGVTDGSIVSVRLWHYRRTTLSGYNGVFASSPYGEGTAVVVNVQPIDVLAVPGDDSPDALSLAVLPNPSLGPARIQYTLPRAARVRLSVYDLAGGRVATLGDGFKQAGRGEFSWDGRGARGERLPAGVYVIELIAGSQRRVGKLVQLGR